MTMKRKFFFLMSLMSCNVAFSQHPYSHGHGGALYWGLVGALAYVIWFLVLHIVPVLWSFIKEMLTSAKEHLSAQSPNALDLERTRVKSTNTGDPYSEEVILGVSEVYPSANEFVINNVPETSIRIEDGMPKFCHHCGAKIDYESGKFCKYCGNELE